MTNDFGVSRRSPPVCVTSRPPHSYMLAKPSSSRQVSSCAGMYCPFSTTTTWSSTDAHMLSNHLQPARIFRLLQCLPVLADHRQSLIGSFRNGEIEHRSADLMQVHMQMTCAASCRPISPDANIHNNKLLGRSG